jgi:hypothetical protein
MQFRRDPVWPRRSRVRPILITTLITVPLAAGLAAGVIATNHPGAAQSQLNLSPRASESAAVSTSGPGRRAARRRPGQPAR